MKKIHTIILGTCLALWGSFYPAHAASEGLRIERDVIVYNITMKEPDLNAVKDGLKSKKPEEMPLAGLSGNTAPAMAYTNYYKLIRNKIRDRLVSRYYTGITDGEINLVFILTSAGKLESVNIDEAGSAKDATLRDITIRSLKESAPFPPFPKSLDAPRMSFDLSVSFRKD